ncbi:MAG UNVERIFIED_CONTAM: hypothetical protein LVR29_05870 [Microcystis novacekii LVE1205-3]
MPKLEKRVFPPGAGIVVRKKAWLDSIPKEPKLSQVGEDIEFLSSMYSKGWQIWFNAKMRSIMLCLNLVYLGNI